MRINLTGWILIAIGIGVVTGPIFRDVAGFGLKLRESGGQVVINSLIAKGPGEKAGLLKEDIIHSVDGANLMGKNLKDASA